MRCDRSAAHETQTLAALVHPLQAATTSVQVAATGVLSLMVSMRSQTAFLCVLKSSLN